jgi:hypothetical protein
MTKSSMASTCSSIVGSFDGHGGLPVQYKVHCPMQHVQGYSRSHWTPASGNGGAPEQYRQHCPMQHVQGYSGRHWMPASGDYLLCIAQAAARATGKQTIINKLT